MRHNEDDTIGRRIAQARREAGLTQEELGQLIGVTTRSVQGYEAGNVIPFRHLRKLENATGKSRGWLLYGDDDSGNVGDVATTLAALVAQIAEDAERIARAAEQLERSRSREQPAPAEQQRERGRQRRRVPRAAGGPA
jgi:transcriptional regulator with XRE-family HTH domain